MTGSVLDERLQETRELIATLKRARVFVPLLLANGVLVPSDCDVTDCARELMGDGDEVERQVERLEKALAAAGVPNTPDLDVPQLFYGHAHKFARAAYLIGIAVGQQLGPNAFATATPSPIRLVDKAVD